MLRETTRDRLARLETAVENLPLNSNNLVITMEVNSVKLANLKFSYDGLARTVTEKIGLILDNVAALERELRGNIRALENYLGLLKCVVSNALLHLEAGLAKINVLEPKSFGGTRNAKELENFLWDVVPKSIETAYQKLGFTQARIKKSNSC